MAMCIALTLQLNCCYSLLPMYNYKTLNHERNQFLLYMIYSTNQNLCIYIRVFGAS